MMQVHYKIFITGQEPENIVYELKCDKEVMICTDGDLQQDLTEPDVIANVTVDGLLCSLYFNALKDENACKRLFKYLRRTHRRTDCNGDYQTEPKRFLINVHVVEPRKNVLDWKGNKMFEQSALERRELDHAFAWFSTLGGAFSALGDYMTDCAIMAGKISTKQFKLALRLGDPSLLARCRLYMALSLIQQRNFKLAKSIIRNEYDLADKQIVKDTKLVSMCRGIWAKWKYDRSLPSRTTKMNV
uniref:Uncharacterized protein F58A4.6 n=1 Tax=Lygus hesperus TaxID=30085 RepID=A0A0A9XMN3_LYGHE